MNKLLLLKNVLQIFKGKKKSKWIALIILAFCAGNLTPELIDILVNLLISSE